MEEIRRKKGAKLLTEAEEQRVHTHGVHTEEAMGDEVGSHYHRLQQNTGTVFICHLELIVIDY